MLYQMINAIAFALLVLIAPRVEPWAIYIATGLILSGLISGLIPDEDYPRRK